MALLNDHITREEERELELDNSLLVKVFSHGEEEKDWRTQLQKLSTPPLYRRLLNENATLLSANSYQPYYWNGLPEGLKKQVMFGMVAYRRWGKQFMALNYSAS